MSTKNAAKDCKHKAAPLPASDGADEADEVVAIGKGKGKGKGKGAGHGIKEAQKRVVQMTLLGKEREDLEEEDPEIESAVPPRPGPRSVTSTATATTGSVATASVANSSPGAYAQTPGLDNLQLRATLTREVIHGLHNPDEEQGLAVLSHPRAAHHQHRTQGLVEASPVSEDEENRKRQFLPQAERQDNKTPPRNRKQKGPLLICLVTTIGLVAAIVATVTVKSKSSSGATEEETTSTPSGSSHYPSVSPSSAPSAEWLLDLPLATRETIVNDPESYQARAYQWLWDDPYLAKNNYTQARLVQRFALACICYATQCEGDTDGEGGWAKKEGWLTYDTHECDWLSLGGFGFESFPDRPALVQALIDFTSFIRARNRTAFIEWEANLVHLDRSQTCNQQGLYKNLFLYKNNLVGTLPPELWTYLTHLESVDLTFNGELGGRIPPDIKRLTNLQFLWLGSNSWTGSLPTELGALSSLQLLRMLGTSIHGPIPSEIGQLSNLVYLSLTSNRLSSTVPEEMSSLSHMVFLALSGNEMTGFVPSTLSQLSGLRTLQLSNNKMTGEFPTELGGLRELRLLDLSGNELTSSIPTELGLLHKTPYVDLQENTLTGRLPSELGLMESLEELHVYLNALTGSLPTELYGLEQLSTFMVHDNPFLAGPIVSPELFAGMSSLQVLSLTDTGLSGEFPPVLCNESKLELVFNCSAILCGCNCSCSSISNNSSGQS